ncbi:MAG: threonylcarbamoyl-AMP synthase [Actinobacteria bacterium]|nr:threonylcarbamoyl-AMP synthase [Actinomycetota bacterium]
MTLLRVDAMAPDPDAIAMAAAALAAGQLVVLPTDSVYGLAADPGLPQAVDRLFEAKSRPRSLAIPVLVSSLAHVKRLVEVDARAERAMGTFWPGPLTLVLRRRPGAGWDLGEAASPGTLAVRMPDHPVALELITQAGPLAVTSANRTGRPTPRTCEGVAAELGDSVSLYLDGGPSPGEVPSTIVDLTGSQPAVLREGALSAAEVRDALG